MASDEKPSPLHEYERAIIMAVGGALMVGMAMGGGKIWDNTLALQGKADASAVAALGTEIDRVKLNFGFEQMNVHRRLDALEARDRFQPRGVP